MIENDHQCSRRLKVCQDINDRYHLAYYICNILHLTTVLLRLILCTYP